MHVSDEGWQSERSQQLPFWEGSSPAALRFGMPLEGGAQYARQLLVVLDLVFVPLALAFGPIYPILESGEVQALDAVLTLFFFVLAVPVRFFTSFVSTVTREEVTELANIREAVLRSAGFWLDLLSMFAAPWLYGHLAVRNEFGHWLQRLSLLRLGKSWQLGRPSLRDVLLGSETFGVLLVKVFLAIFVVSHLFACTWFYGKLHSAAGVEGVLDDPDGPRGTQMHILGVHYFRSLKDGIYMLCTWGGPHAVTEEEMALVCVMGPISTVLSGVILAQIVEANARRGVLQCQYANRMAMVNAACDGLALPTDLRVRISRYHSYLAFNQADETSKDMLFGGLSVNLFAEVKLHILREVLVTTSFFQGLSPRIVSFLIVSFEENTVSSGDFVCRKGEVGNQLYIITKGSVGVCVQDLESVIRVMGAGSCFGEITLVFPFPRTAWVYAATFAMLMSLGKDRFDHVLHEFPEEKRLIIGRIVQATKHLVPDLQGVIRDGDQDKAALAREVLREILSHHAGVAAQAAQAADASAAARQEEKPGLSRWGSAVTLGHVVATSSVARRRTSLGGLAAIESLNSMAEGGGAQQGELASLHRLALIEQKLNNIEDMLAQHTEHRPQLAGGGLPISPQRGLPINPSERWMSEESLEIASPVVTSPSTTPKVMATASMQARSPTSKSASASSKNASLRARFLQRLHG